MGLFKKTKNKKKTKMQNVSKKRKYVRKTKKPLKKNVSKTQKDYQELYDNRGNRMNKTYLNRNLIRAEEKLFDFQLNQIPVQNAFGNSNLIIVNGMRKGTGSYQRIGDYIRITRIKYRLRILRTNAPNVTPSTEFRFGLVYDSMTNGNNMANQSVFRSLGSDGNYYNGGPNVFQNPTNQERYRVLCNHYYVAPLVVSANVPNQSLSIAMSPAGSYDSFVEGNLKVDLPVRFLPTIDTGLIGDIAIGSIGYYCLCPAIDYLQDWQSFIDLRIYFEDI